MPGKKVLNWHFFLFALLSRSGCWISIMVQASSWSASLERSWHCALISLPLDNSQPKLSGSNIRVIQYISLMIQQIIVEMPRNGSERVTQGLALGSRGQIGGKAWCSMRTGIYSIIFLTALLSFALLSISVLCVAVWSSILFKLHVLTERRRKCRVEGRHPAEGPSWAAPVECSACEFYACVRKIGVDGSQLHIWPLHYRGHKERQVTWGRTYVTLVQSGIF